MEEFMNEYFRTFGPGARRQDHHGPGTGIPPSLPRRRARPNGSRNSIARWSADCIPTASGK